MIAARHLGQSEICGEARRLLAENLVFTVDDLRRDAFVAAVALGEARPGDLEAAQRLNAAAMGALSPDDRLAVAGWYADYVEDVRRGTIPAIHTFDRPLAMDLDGRLVKPADFTPATIIGSADNLWCSTPPGGDTVAVVLNHLMDRAAPLPPPEEDLGLVFLGIAWAATNELDKVSVGRCYHRGSKEPRYEWSPVIEEGKIEALWQRIRVAATKPTKTVVGGHCETCLARGYCSEWLLPALASAHDALLPFQRKSGVAITKQNASRALRIVGAMRDTMKVMEAQLRSFARDQGGIADGRGNVWGPVQGRGRQGEVFEWREQK